MILLDWLRNRYQRAATHWHYTNLIDPTDVDTGDGNQVASDFNRPSTYSSALLQATDEITAAALQKSLEADSEDAQCVRFGLFRRGLDIGRVKAARVLGPDSVPGYVVSLQAEKSVLVVLGAPAEPKIVWDQTPATDILVFIQRVARALERLILAALSDEPAKLFRLVLDHFLSRSRATTNLSRPARSKRTPISA